MPFKSGDPQPIILPATRDKPLNPRQEQFALALARGMSQRAAYKAAGYGRSSRGPAVLLALPNVAARVEELLAQARALNRVTIEEIDGRLARIVEDNLRIPSVAAQNLARRALMDRARLNGLLDPKARAPAPPEPITQIRRVIVWPDGREEEY